MRAASAARIAASFSVSPATLWRWKSLATSSGVAGLISDKRGPQGNSNLTDELITQIHALKRTGLSNRAAGQAAGVSEFSVRRALKLDPTTGKTPEPTPTAAPVSMHEAEAPAQEQLPLLADPMVRKNERATVISGEPIEALPVFTPAARIPYAGMLLALAALEATGLLECMEQVHGNLLPGFYGLNPIILETIFRTLGICQIK